MRNHRQEDGNEHIEEPCHEIKAPMKRMNIMVS
jgi:hypothetical protein